MDYDITTYEHLVKRYNNTKHIIIKMKPSSVRGKKNEAHLLHNAYYKREIVLSNRKPPKYQVGDFVRIPKYKADFTKGYCH